MDNNTNTLHSPRTQGGMTDMTVGSPARGILRFAVPLVLGYILQQMYQVIDAVIVGRWIGVGALAAVGASSSIMFLIMGFCNGSCAGFAIPVAQAFGAKDFAKMRSLFFRHSPLPQQGEQSSWKYSDWLLALQVPQIAGSVGPNKATVGQFTAWAICIGPVSTLTIALALAKNTASCCRFSVPARILSPGSLAVSAKISSPSASFLPPMRYTGSFFSSWAITGAAIVSGKSFRS